MPSEIVEAEGYRKRKDEGRVGEIPAKAHRASEIVEAA
jgi:hypothetical protein